MTTLRLMTAVVLIIAASILALSGADAAGKIRVVATIPDLKALTEEIGGSAVDVVSLTRGTQNAHEAEIRPTMMLKIRRADALIQNGLDLDSWVDVAVQGANNPNIIGGSPGRIDISHGIQVLEVPGGRVDRSMGDIHPMGNPHFSLDPGLAPLITRNIVDGLARVAPEHRSELDRNRQTFLAKLDEAMGKWTKIMEPFRGARVLVYHPQWIYFLTRFGITQVGTLEDRPGIPASPGHVARVIEQMKAEKIKVIIVEPWNDRKLAARVAEEAGAKSLVLASMVGGVKGADTYLEAIDYNVRTLAEALK